MSHTPTRPADGGHRPVEAAFVLEQTLGHVTHSANLHDLIPRADPSLVPHFVDVEFAVDGERRTPPGWSNWTVRAGVRARRGLRDLRRTMGADPDAAFVHTQVPAVLLQDWMRRVPTVVSIDATPLQYDELGDHYAHDQGPDWLESLKLRANRRCFARAAHLVTWSEWARQGLATGYGVPPERVTVISPGVDVDKWQRPSGARADDGTTRILFVGGDLRRKGGDLLIDAFRELRNEIGSSRIELHLATTSDVDAEPGVVVHRGLTPNSRALIDLYHASDIFCLPTLGDCLPMVLAEASAAGLALISTDVGAIHEIVRPGETGELIPPGDRAALVESMRALIVDEARRRYLATAASELARSSHDAATNAGRIVEILQRVATGGRTPGATEGQESASTDS